MLGRNAGRLQEKKAGICAGRLRGDFMRVTIEIDDGKDVKVTKIEEREQEQPEGMEELTQEEAERFETASDIASYCEYLEESELIQLKLIAAKCKARKEREK